MTQINYQDIPSSATVKSIRTSVNTAFDQIVQAVNQNVTNWGQVANLGALVALTDAKVGDEASLPDGSVYRLGALPATTSGNWKKMAQITDIASVDLSSVAKALTDSNTVFSANNNIAVNSINRYDLTSGSLIGTLPTAPADKTLVVAKVVVQPVGSTNTLTLQASGSDVFNKTGGSTALTLSLLYQSTFLQYNAAGSIWTVLAGDVPLGQLDSRYASDVVVLPVSNGTDDTATINSYLTTYAGRTIRGRAGQTYVTTDNLVIRSGTTLDMTGCTINGPTTKNLLRNFASVPSRVLTDAATTSGSAVVTSASGNFTSADSGHSVGVVGAGQNYGRSDAPGTLVGSVQSFTSTSITISRSATLSKTGATLNIYPSKDADITVIGGIWNGGNRDSVGQTTASHVFLFRRCDNITIRPTRMITTGSNGIGGRYAISVSDCTKIRGRDIDFSTAGDGFHVTGPATDIIITDLTGTTGDDMVAFTTVDGQSQTASLLGDTEGDISRAYVDRLLPNNAWTAVKMTSGIGTNNVARTLEGVFVGKIEGATVNGAVNIQDYSGAGAVGLVHINDVACVVGGSNAMVSITSSNFKRVNIDRLTWMNTGSPTIGLVNIAGTGKTVRMRDLNARANNATQGRVVYVNGATLDELILDGMDTPDTPPAYHGIDIVGTSVTIGNIKVNNINRTSVASNLVNVSATAYSIGHIFYNNVFQSAGSLLQTSVDSANTINVKAVDCYQAAGAFFIVQCPLNVMWRNCEITTPSGGTIRAASAAATPIRISAGGWGSNTLSITRTATQAISMHGPDIKTDISILTPVDGDQVQNSNSGLSCGTGPVIYSAAGTGNKWKHLYSGATY